MTDKIQVSAYVGAVEYRKLKSRLALNGQSFSEWLRQKIEAALGIEKESAPAMMNLGVPPGLLKPVSPNAALESGSTEAPKKSRTSSVRGKGVVGPTKSVKGGPPTGPKETKYRTEKMCGTCRSTILGGRCPTCD